MATEYIVICQSIMGNERNGFETIYGFDGERFNTRRSAIRHGFTKDRSDDFNIGVIEGGELVSLDWMTNPVDTDEALMDKIAGEIGL